MICVFYVFRKSKRSQMVSIADQVLLLPCSDPKEILRIGRTDARWSYDCPPSCSLRGTAHRSVRYAWSTGAPGSNDINQEGADQTVLNAPAGRRTTITRGGVCKDIYEWRSDNAEHFQDATGNDKDDYVSLWKSNSCTTPVIPCPWREHEQKSFHWLLID